MAGKAITILDWLVLTSDLASRLLDLLSAMALGAKDSWSFRKKWGPGAAMRTMTGKALSPIIGKVVAGASLFGMAT